MAAFFLSIIKHKGRSNLLIAASFICLIPFQANASTHKESENAGVIAYISPHQDLVTTVETEAYVKQIGQNISKKEAFKAILSHKILLLYSREAPFANIKSSYPALFNKVLDEELAKIDFTEMQPSVAKKVEELVAEKVEEELLIQVFIGYITANCSITYNEVKTFYEEKERQQSLPKIKHQVVIEQVIYVSNQENLEEELIRAEEEIYLPLKLKDITFKQFKRQVKKIYPNQSKFKRYYLMPNGNSTWLAQAIPSVILQKFDREVSKWQVGDISKPHIVKFSSGLQAIRILRIKRIILPHIANLQEDYDIIMHLALQEKKQKMVKKWLDDKLKKLVTILDEKYADVLNE